MLLSVITKSMWPQAHVWCIVRCGHRSVTRGVYCVSGLQTLSSRAMRAPRMLTPKTVLYNGHSKCHKMSSEEALSRVSPGADLIQPSDPGTAQEITSSFLVYKDFISEEEEQSLFEEVEPYLKRLRYEKDHWDDAISGYRETEKKSWRQHNMEVLQRVRDVAFSSGVRQLSNVHVLDLERTGYIKPHVDSVRFCGSTIAGLSLLSHSVMRLAKEKNKDCHADVYLPRRSLYIMKGASRYLYTHAVLGVEDSFFRKQEVPRARRISIMCRNEPHPDDEQ